MATCNLAAGGVTDGSGEAGERLAGERRTSGSDNTFRPFRYRDLGSATCIFSYGRAVGSTEHCIPVGGSGLVAKLEA